MPHRSAFAVMSVRDLCAFLLMVALVVVCVEAGGRVLQFRGVLLASFERLQLMRHFLKKYDNIDTQVAASVGILKMLRVRQLPLLTPRGRKHTYIRIHTSIVFCSQNLGCCPATCLLCGWQSLPIVAFLSRKIKALTFLPHEHRLLGTWVDVGRPPP